MNRVLAASCLIALTLPPASRASAADPPDPWVTGITAPQHFAVVVADVDRSAAWYRDVFGLRVLGGSAAEDGSWRIENLGSASLLVEVIRDDRAQEVDRARGFRKVGFQVPDVAAVADRVERATGERPRVLDVVELGIRILQIRDPDGNVVQLSSPAQEAGAGR